MKPFISKLTATMLALSLTLISSASLASSCASHSAVNKTKSADVHKNAKTKPKASAQQPKKAPSFMFVIDAKQGEITKDKKGQYHLILKKVDMNQVIMFSDRPQRIVKYITGKDLQTLWKEGSISFQKSPPNAVLSGKGMKTQIVVLNGISVTTDSIKMPISFSSSERHTVGNVQLPNHIMNGISLVIDEDTGLHSCFGIGISGAPPCPRDTYRLRELYTCCKHHPSSILCACIPPELSS